MRDIATDSYLKGIMVVTDISLLGWLVSTADGARALTVVLAIIGVVALTFGIVVLHRQIERRIDEIGRLSPWKLSPLSSCSPSYSSLSALHLTLPVERSSAF